MTYESRADKFRVVRASDSDRDSVRRCSGVEVATSSGDRVKTDARHSRHLTRMLRLDEVASVPVPTVAQEAARDLVRAREDSRGDLMRVGTVVQTVAFQQRGVCPLRIRLRSRPASCRDLAAAIVLRRSDRREAIGRQGARSVNPAEARYGRSVRKKRACERRSNQLITGLLVRSRGERPADDRTERRERKSPHRSGSTQTGAESF